jgi:hypothetical protein
MNFIRIIINALNIYFVIDITGPPRDFLRYIYKNCDFSLFGIIYMMRYIFQLLIPALPFARRNWLHDSINNLLFGPSPEVIISKLHSNDNITEKWFYLNGMGNSKRIALQTRDRLEDIFKRPIDCIYNPTDSIIIDLFECITEKQWGDKYPITSLVYQTLINSLTNNKITKVVFICHSQGTIITENIIKMLDGLMPKFISKLEIYAFANCSNEMNYICEYNGKKCPYIENIGNYNDTVARLGMFAPKQLVSIVGKKYINKIKRGHIMDISYIDKFDTQKEYIDEEGNYSKLYEYIKN